MLIMWADYGCGPNNHVSLISVAIQDSALNQRTCTRFIARLRHGDSVSPCVVWSRIECDACVKSHKLVPNGRVLLGAITMLVVRREASSKC